MLHGAKSGGRKLQSVDQAVALRIAVKYQRNLLRSLRGFKRQVGAGIGFKDQNGAAALFCLSSFRTVCAYCHAERVRADKFARDRRDLFYRGP